MYSYYQILSTPTADTPGALVYLHFDDKRYIFGRMSEGTQRVIMDRNTKMINTSDIFLTGQTRWANTGGLLGLVLSLADSTSAAAEQRKHDRSREVQPPRGLRVHGGPNLMHTIATARHFVFRKGMPVDVREYGRATDANLDEPSFSDELINVWALPVSPSGISRPSNSPNSSRKRSFSEFAEGQSPGIGDLQDSSIDSEKAQQIRKAVVSEMFDSNWKFDALFESNLAEVNLPAALFIRNPETNKIERYKGKMPGDEGFDDLEPIQVLVRKPWPAAEIHQLPSTSPSYEAMSYIVKDHDQRGKFDVKKALELNVPKGWLFSELAAGRSVTSTDGKTVTPDMVLGERRLSTGTAILDLPSPDYIGPLVDRLEWKNEKVMNGVAAVLWFLGPGVLTDSRWLEFVRSMGALEHIVISPESCSNQIMFDNMSAASIRRHAVSPDHFPMPVHDQPSSRIEENGGAQAFESLRHQFNFRSGPRGLLIQNRPFRDIETSQVQEPLDVARVTDNIPEDVVKLGEEIRVKVKDNDQQDFVGGNVEIITLGTGSSLPSKYRNVSATLVRVPGYGSYLLDCGENTLGQLRRVFAADELKKVLRDLKMIWISHLHADHHLGTTSVIEAWYKQNLSDEKTRKEANGTIPGDLQNSRSDPPDDDKRLFVAANGPMIDWLQEYSDVEDFGHHKVVSIRVSDEYLGDRIRNQLYWKSTPLDFSAPSTLTTALSSSTGIQDLSACPVKHCPGAKGVALTFSNGFKVTYSGDCRPSEKLAKIGEDSTVLIHEATFGDDLRGDAIAKQHSTISEALGIAVRMKARRVVLTHFSQRYQKLPLMENLSNSLLAKYGTSADGFENGSEETADQDAFDGPIDASVGNLAAQKDDDGAEEPSSSDITMPSRLHPSPTDTAVGGSDNLVVRSNDTGADTALWRRSVVDLPIVEPPHVAVAFDYMRIKVRDIEHMHQYTPLLLKLYEVSGEGTADEVNAVNYGKKNKSGKLPRKKGGKPETW